MTSGRKAATSGSTCCNWRKYSASPVPVGQGDIDAAALLTEGEVVFTVHREREHGGVFRENGSGSIALMDVQIDHCRAGGQPVAAQREDGHSQIVEHAESGTFAPKRVVRAAGQISAEASLHGFARGRQRAAHRGDCTAYQLRRPWEADAAHHAVTDGTVQNCVHVGSIVRQFNGGGVCHRRRLKIVNAVRGQQRAQEGVLFDRELVARRQRDWVVVAVKEAWARLHRAAP